MNRNFIFASLLVAIAVNISIIGCHRKGDNESSVKTDTASTAAAINDTMRPAPDTIRNPYEKAEVEIKTFPNGADIGGFGYDVYLDNKLYVHQPHVPAVAGNKGFSSKENAKRTGEYVAYKIKHNIMPPSLTPGELDSLGVLR